MEIKNLWRYHNHNEKINWLEIPKKPQDNFLKIIDDCRKLSSVKRIWSDDCCYNFPLFFPFGKLNQRFQLASLKILEQRNNTEYCSPLRILG